MKITISVEEALMLNCMHDMRKAYRSYKDKKVDKDDACKVMADEFNGCMRLLDAAGVQ